MKTHSLEDLTGLIIDARVCAAKLDIEESYLNALDGIYIHSEDDDIPQNFLNELRWGSLDIEMALGKKAYVIASIIMRCQVENYPGTWAFSNVHPMIASCPTLLEAFDIARDEVKDDMEQEGMIATWLEDPFEEESVYDWIYNDQSAKRAQIEAKIADDQWTELNLPSPEEFGLMLSSGTSVNLNGSSFVYDADSEMIWITNFYGVDSGFSGKPDVTTAKKLLSSMALDEEYGAVPLESSAFSH